MKPRRPNSYNRLETLLLRHLLTSDWLLDKARLPRKLGNLTPWQVKQGSPSGAYRLLLVGGSDILNNTSCRYRFVSVAPQGQGEASIYKLRSTIIFRPSSSNCFQTSILHQFRYRGFSLLLGRFSGVSASCTFRS
jgi:hypothetical protein